MAYLRRRRQQHDRPADGFTYLVLIFVIAVMGLLLSGYGQSWKLSARREKETELLFVGSQLSAALESYRRVTQQGQPDAPANLDELVEDKRFPYPVRHLRKVFRDPMTGKTDWKLNIQNGRIVAISSRSEKEALRDTKTLPKFVSISSDVEEPRYCDWLFTKPLQANISGK
jgi:type II secretory pathway pseudopilin PulG